MAKLGLSAVGYAYNAPPEHARYEFVARIPQNKFQSTVGAVGLNYKSDIALASVLQAASQKI